LKISADFVVSAAGASDFPTDGLSEVAVVGRSNVGKSTLINALLGRRLARTSAAPGKTRLINFYRVRVNTVTLYLADLPGYGYARGGAAARRTFDALTRDYFSRMRVRRDTATNAGHDRTLLLVDARHSGLASDLSARQWLEELSLPTTVVATKIDKLTRAERPRVHRTLEAALYAPVVPTSAVTGEGLKELWTLILAPPSLT
jgi:GTP-binding protein